ncbi:hypothetical protein [Halarchaeum sp. P4]|uniref:hypothetical protein n=1 Tax=Halarchaeum sp. P4 TaxID=3421639 RepID=UPI003EBD2A03
MLTDLLHWLGVSGSIVLVGSVALTVYHGRHLFRLGALLGTWLRFSGLLAILAAVAYSGLVPGIDLDVDFGTLGSLAGTAWHIARPWLGRLVEVVL